MGVVYNERSWAIDLIGHIKIVVSSNNRSIKDAGGEQTVKAEGESQPLFVSYDWYTISENLLTICDISYTLNT